MSCQPIGSAEDGLDHVQVLHNGASIVVDVPGVGAVKQFGNAYRLEHHVTAMPSPPPAVGEHTASVLASLADVTPSAPCRRTTRTLRIRSRESGCSTSAPRWPARSARWS